MKTALTAFLFLAATPAAAQDRMRSCSERYWA